MSDRDAFGNELRPSDPESAFGAAAAPATGHDAPPTTRPTEGPAVGAGTGTDAPTREPATSFRPAPAPDAPPASVRPAPAGPTPTTAGARGPAVVPRVIGGCVSFVAIVVAVGGCALAGLVGSIGDGVDTFRSISTEFSRTTPAPPTTAPAPTPGRAADPPRGLGRRSLLRRSGFSRAITRLRGAGLGRPRLLRVAPDRIDTQLVTRTGRLRSVQILPGGKLATLSTTSSGGFPNRDLVSLATVDRGAPQRLARAAAGRARLPLTRVDYLVLSVSGGSARWTAFLRDGPAYSADRTGRIERRVR